MDGWTDDDDDVHARLGVARGRADEMEQRPDAATLRMHRSTSHRRSYLTPAGESTLSKRNALLGTSSHSNSLDPYGAYSEGAAGTPYYANGNAGAGTSRSPSPYGTRPGSSASQYASNRTAEDLESQNDEELDGLGAKVKMLKDVSVGLSHSCPACSASPFTWPTLTPLLHLRSPSA